MKYEDFIKSKVALAEDTGIQIDNISVNPLLKPHQRAIVEWAVRGGRRAIFASFGLGKTFCQLEIVRLILEKTPGNGLIVMPLGVRQEFKQDAVKLGINVAFVRTNEEVRQLSLLPELAPRIFLTNYESIREGKLDPREFAVVSLDEAAILRGFGGTKTFREFMRLFEGTSTYRFVATATPSPNEYIELLSYAAFLEVMDVGQAKTRFFKRDATKADQLTLHPHKEKEFWLWVASWALFLQRPSDLGYSDEGYELPPLDVRWHEVPSDHSNAGQTRDGQLRLLRNTSIGVTDAAREKRDSLDVRIEKLLELRAENPNAHRIIWHDLEAERAAIEAALPDCETVWGARDLDEREQALIGFANGSIPEIALKPVMSGAGGNYQRHCSWAIFLGIGFKFNDFIQAIHRIHRFLQGSQVRIDLIYSEAERDVRQQLERKWNQHNTLVAEMSAVIREYGLSTAAMSTRLRRAIGVERSEESGKDWRLVHNDCVEETCRMESGSVGLILTSIPFSTQYEYSPSYNDFGHNEDSVQFWRQMDYLTPQLFRVLQAGRVCAIHVKDRITPGGVNRLGFQTVAPLHAEAIFHYQRHGFAYLGMKTITTDVVRENNQTYRLGWTEQCKDGSRMGVGMPEYLLLFRKPPTDLSDGYADVPVVKEKPLCDDNGEPMPFDSRNNWKQPVPGTGYSRARWQMDAHGYARSSGDRLLSSDELRHVPHEKLYKIWREHSINGVYSLAEHVDLAERLDYEQRLPATFMLLPPHSINPDVWTDVTRMRTLNGAQSAKGKEMHLCPMQFDVADRTIIQFSNKGDVVYDPFSGLGTVALQALKAGRIGLGCELSPAYHADAVWYLRNQEAQSSTPSLFGLMEAEEELEAVP